MSITSENIQFYRKQQNLTQRQLASLTNLSRSTIASYESGRTEPDIASLQNFSNIFNIALDDLLCTSQAVLLARNATAKKFCYCFIAIINIIMLFRNVAISLLSMNRFYLPIDTPLNDAQSNTLHLINMISNGIVFAEGVTIGLCIIFYLAVFIKYQKKHIQLKSALLFSAWLLLFIIAQTLLFASCNPNVSFYDYFHIIQSIAFYTIFTVLFLLLLDLIFKNKRLTGKCN